ncbi:MAG: phenylalanine--tRNA ligase subunit beta [Candidatus Gottesmanbacteria bacterium]
MNILVPDAWLREYLKTDATPKQLKEYLSLCGPSIERINEVHGETVYDIEVTGNRPDTMSIIGIAREAGVILPRFGINATVIGDPYQQPTKIKQKKSHKLSLNITTDSKLNPRWTSVIFDHVVIKQSPAWLAKRLELVGVRSINNVIDITNYLMHAYGQPAHVFDYDKIEKKTMTLRGAVKGEQVTTLDGKTHSLQSGDIVIEDGEGTFIDLCGIMGGKNSAISENTTRVVLFLQTYNPVQIRKTSMALAHHSEAAGLFEKGLDTELVMPVFLEGIQLMQKLTDGKIASSITDIYPNPYVAPTVKVCRKKIDNYIGMYLETEEIKTILTALGCETVVTDEIVTVTPPSYRRDITIDVDIIEELARIYGYHTIKGKLPETEPPMVYEDPILSFEQTLKTKLADWGYTETYTYSMISEELMDLFHLPKDSTYSITNPLSNDWVYMRPTLLPSMLLAMKQNIPYESDLKLFEISMTYAFKEKDIPEEQSTLIVAVSGARYGKIKGVAESIFALFGVPFPETTDPANTCYRQDRSLRLANFGQLGEIHDALLQSIGLTKAVTVLELSIRELMRHVDTQKHYVPIPKNPASFEDMAFIVPEKTYIAPMIKAIRSLNPIIKDVSLFDSYKNIRTFHITYQSDTKNLTKENTAHIRETIIKHMKHEFHATLKN